MKNDNTFEKIYESSISLDDVFSNLLSSLNKAIFTLQDSISSGLLIESFNQLKEKFDDIKQNFKERISHIHYNCDLLKSKIKKGYFKDIQERNFEIEELTANYFGLLTSYNNSYKKFENDDELNQLRNTIHDYKEELRKLILDYNEKAKVNHKAKLLTLEEAQQIVKQRLIDTRF